MDRVKVLVVEDVVKILKNQIKLLENYPELEIVGSALSGEAALEEVERCKPDVILCDIGLPQMSGIDVTRQVKAKHPEIEILIFTIFDEEEKVLEAIKAGASGYLLKGAEADKVVAGIKEVHSGGSVIQPNLARSLLRHFRMPEEGPAPAEPPPAPPPKEQPTGGLQVEVRKQLTARELEVLQMITKGLSNSEAAGVLGLSKATIRTHLEHIYQKLDVTNRVEAVTEGVRQGIIEV